MSLATPVNTLSLDPLLFSPKSFNPFDGKNGGKKECPMCRHQSLRHRIRHHVIERSQQSRHCLHDDCRPEGDDLAGDAAEELGELIEAWVMSDAQLEEQLQDPLYLLLVRHAIFCRQIENLLKRTADQPQTQHRTMRRPPVPVYRSSRPTGISAG